MDRFTSQHRFLARTRSSFGTEDVVVVHNEGMPDESRLLVEAHIQPEMGFFEIDTPIYEGDAVELDDPRGGRRMLYAKEVNIFKSSSSMSHTEVKWGPRPTWRLPAAELERPTQAVYHGPVVIVNGDHAQIAWDGGSNRRSDQVVPEFAELAVAVSKAMELLATHPASDPDEAAIADEVGRQVLTELTKAEPEKKKIKAGLATLRGFLASLSGAATVGLASGAVEEIVRQLILN